MSPSENPSLFSRKLKRLVEGRVKTEIDSAAKLRKGTVSLVLHRGNVPPPTEGIQLARSLGVCPIWLMDESDSRLDPVWAIANPPLADATDELIIENLRERYAAVALDLHHQLQTIDGIALYEPASWQQNALDIFLAQGVSDKSKSAVAMVDHSLKTVSRAKRLWESSSIKGTWILMPYAAEEDISPRELEFENLEADAKRISDDNPGIKFIVNFINAGDAAKWSGDTEVRKQHFFSRIAPFFVAKIIHHWSMEDHPRRDEIIASLREKGYIQDDGKPIKMPEFIAWHPDDELPEDRPEIPKNKGKRRKK